MLYFRYLLSTIQIFDFSIALTKIEIDFFKNILNFDRSASQLSYKFLLNRAFYTIKQKINSANIQRYKTQIENIRFDNSKSTALKSVLIDKNLSILSCILKRYALTDNSSIYNISINTNRLLFVSIKISELSFKKIKIIYNIDSQILYYKFIILNQTESAIIVFDSRSEIFAIKKYKRDSIFRVQSVRFKVKSNCIVSIFKIYTIAIDIYIVYKYINVVLRYILITLKSQLVLYKIATICRKIYLFSVQL